MIGTILLHSFTHRVTILRVLIVWESIEHHYALTNDKELYPVLLDSLGKGVAKFDLHHHATLSPNDPYPALDSPLTEFAVWKMNEEVDRAKFMDKFLLFVENGIRQLPIQIGGWGASVEDDRQLTVVAGWENLEVRELFGTIKESLFIVLTLDIRNSIMLS